MSKLISRSPKGQENDRPVGFSIRDSDRSVIINVTGDGNWVQVYPRPDEENEEE